jgi:cathepsin A (carboxypeptidase C)
MSTINGGSNMSAPDTMDDSVTSLPGLDSMQGVQFAGYASIYGAANPKPGPDDDENLFYWFVGTEDYAERPTILWTNGGPGSSSFWGFFIENGPYEIGGTSEQPVLTPRPSAWNNYANYLIFEHPLSVTLSFANDAARLPQDAQQGNRQLYQALLSFIAKHPEVASQPLILAGESYAGTYLPLLAEVILEGNATGGTKLDLKLVVLLDAWVNPFVQMAQDTNYAFAHGLISAREKAVLDETYAGANLANIDSAIQSICGAYMTNIAQQADPPTTLLQDYINRDDVRAAIHVSPHQPQVTQLWSKAIGDLYQSTVNDSYAGTVEELLGNNLHVMVVSGLNDAKDCNFLGTGAWLELLQGDAAYAFKTAPTTQWQATVEQQTQVLGFIQDGGLLSWVKVRNAGHMAVMDQPLLINLILEKLQHLERR